MGVEVRAVALAWQVVCDCRVTGWYCRITGEIDWLVSKSGNLIMIMRIELIMDH